MILNLMYIDAVPKKGELQVLSVMDNIVEYSNIGTCLLNDHYGNKIKKIEKEYKSVTAIVEEIFRLWTNGEGATKISWTKLVTCLRIAKLKRLANEIEAVYCATEGDKSQREMPPKIDTNAESPVDDIPVFLEPQTQFRTARLVYILAATVVTIIAVTICSHICSPLQGIALMIISTCIKPR